MSGLTYREILEREHRLAECVEGSFWLRTPESHHGPHPQNNLEASEGEPAPESFPDRSDGSSSLSSSVQDATRQD